MTKHEMNQLTAAYLESFGIETNRMPMEGWDTTGYTLLGGPAPYGDRSQVERHPWPEGFDYQEMLAHWAADEPSRRITRRDDG